VLHTLPISSNLFLSVSLFFTKSTSYEAPHYAVFINNLPLHLSLVKIFSSDFVPSQMSEIKLQNHTKHRQNYDYVYSDCYVFRQQTRRQSLLDWMIASIT
jgi:hypothetical protein